MEDILAAARDQPDSVADDDSDDSDTSGEEEKDQVTINAFYAVRFTHCDLRSVLRSAFSRQTQVETD